MGCLDVNSCKGVAAFARAPFGLECEGVAGLGAAPSRLAQKDANNPWVSWALTEFFSTEPLNVMRLK